jgi:protocatechuate 3,4-dioxygenase beta subunit
MRRPIAFALLIAVLLAAPFSASRAQDASTGAIEGTVHGVDADLLPSVMIMAFDPDSSSGQMGHYLALPEPDGKYRIDGVAPGTWFVSAHSPEYGQQFFDGAATVSDATPVTVAAGDLVGGIDFHLSRPGAGTGSITGVVLAADTWLPVAARVRVTSPTMWYLGFETTTDVDGNYRLDSLASGSYLVQAHAEGFVSEYFDDAIDFPTATPVLVQEPAETAGIDFALDRAGSIAGLVLGRDGQPFEGANVTAWSGSPWDSTGVVPPDSSWGDGGIGSDGSWIGSWRGAFSAGTDADGRYRIVGLPPGSYLVSADGWTGWWSATVWYDGTQDPTLATPVDVQAGSAVEDIDFVLPLATGEGTIAGRVVDDSGDPVAGAYVNAVGGSDPAGMECCPGWGGTMSGLDGSYVLAGLPPGEYLVYAALYGNWTVLERWYPDAETPAEAEPVAVVRDQTTSGIDIVLPVNQYGASVSGIVSDTGGEPLAWAQVLVQSLDDLTMPLDRVPIQAWAWTDSSGAYTAGGLPAGTYVVSVSWWDGDRYAHGWYDGAATLEEATPVVLAEDEERTGVDVVLDPEYWYGGIGGQVLDSDGVPIERALVQVQSTSAVEGFAPFRFRDPHAVTDAEGRFVIGRLAVGDYLLRAFAEGAFAWYDAVPVAAWATPVSVTGGDTTAVELELERRDDGPGQVEGRAIVDHSVDWVMPAGAGSDDVPSIAVVTARPMVTILGWPESERFYTTVTRGDGTYSLRGLPVGEYVMRAFAPDYVEEFYDDAFDPSEADPVKVDGLLPSTGIDFALIPMYWFGAEDGAERAGMVGVHGAVVDESDAAVPGATVFLMNPDGVAVASTLTAADGTYALSGVMPGSYRLMVAKEGFSAAFNGGAASLDGAVPLDLSVGTVVVDLTLRVGGATDAETGGDLPRTYRLRGNYPNPFNPVTTVLVDLPEMADVDVQVFDLLGRRVLDVSAGPTAAGDARPIQVDASGLASGMYLYRVRATGVASAWSAVGRMMLVK